jgi:hypothetical protein
LHESIRQLSQASSRMLRSDENFPARATLRTAFSSQRGFYGTTHPREFMFRYSLSSWPEACNGRHRSEGREPSCCNSNAFEKPQRLPCPRECGTFPESRIRRRPLTTVGGTSRSRRDEVRARASVLAYSTTPPQVMRSRTAVGSRSPDARRDRCRAPGTHMFSKWFTLGAPPAFHLTGYGNWGIL